MAHGDLAARLRLALCNLPNDFDNKYTDQAREKLLDTLFRSLTNDSIEYLHDLFPKGIPASYSLQEAQGTLEETEYTEAARGHPCGHILKAGEATYRCATCSADPTCVLCTRCFAASDHEGHTFEVSISNGNSGCCDCGDVEAWRRPVRCAIHSYTDGPTPSAPQEPPLPDDLANAVHATIGATLDYFCDVISCSPENLRHPKTIDSVKQDELQSRLHEKTYGTPDAVSNNPEYNLLIWNDEKHTMDEVLHQVARACRNTTRFGRAKANETHDIGRSIISQSTDLKELLRRAKVIEEIKVTVTIRSARDTFREEMCGTILEWLNDIVGCVIRGNGAYLRQAICEEMLQVWHLGSQAWNAKIGREGLEDHEADEDIYGRSFPDTIQILLHRNQQIIVQPDGDGDDDLDLDDQDAEIDDAGLGDDMDDDDDDDYERVDSQMDDSIIQVTDAESINPHNDAISDVEDMDTDGDNDFLDATERMDADDNPTVPVPPPAQPAGQMDTEPAIALANDELSRHPSITLSSVENQNFRNVPRTPGTAHPPDRRAPHADSTHWRAPADVKGKAVETSLPVWEDLRKNVRLDAMVLFDLRLWKKLRTGLRNLLISTMTKVPQFKRILGLRFAGLYTTLAQLYLIADREPDHSILHLSVQILTTPSIAEEVIQKGNFLTNLMAILYTFLTTRQVGYPDEVDPDASLGFDAGSVANRRLYQFFNDLRYFLSAPSIRERVRKEKQYLLQYLDLAKLSQGISPNVRAVGEHVEYEADTWISASLLTKEINKICRQLTEAYQASASPAGIDEYLQDAIRQTAITTILVCSGLDHQRFEQSEIKELIKFRNIGPFPGSPRIFKTVDFSVDKGTMSFHHPLHYTMSWLVENGKDSFQTIQEFRNTASELVTRFNASALTNKRIPLHKLYESGEDALLGFFDFPLRVCVWLAQMRANMWVRNGMSLRHQMNQYKSVSYRDLGYHRDLLLLQTALVTCDPERMLASMIDRFGLVSWVSEKFEPTAEVEEQQLVDLAEDLVYLLINILSDRDTLAASADDPESQLRILRKDIAHTLCFKPLSFTDLTNRLTERTQDHERLHEVLESMTTFRAPEALNDSGLFELKPEYLQELDPYNSHFSKNQRDEAENIYKNWVAKKTNKQPEDIVLEPKLTDIRCEAYAHLTNVIHTPLFTTMLYFMLTHVVLRHGGTSTISASRAESFLQIVLHLVLISTMEDHTVEENDTKFQSLFIRNSLCQPVGPQGQTIVTALHKIWLAEDFSGCRSKVRHILRIFHRQWPEVFTNATKGVDFPAARLDASSPANLEIEIEAKKKQAAERKAKIMAQMQQQQQSFMNNQGVVDWGDDDMSDTEPEMPASSEVRHWKYPNGVCIQCREETNDARFYGTFAMVTDGYVLRQTPAEDIDFVQEVIACPENLDESNEGSRPFGVAGANVELVKRYASDGSENHVSKRGLSKGWPRGSTESQPLSMSCGHIMHFNCFENYYESVRRRHAHQIARRQPERVSQNEFVCPLCKALANVFLPIVYKSTEQSYPGLLQPESSFDMFVDGNLQAMKASMETLEADNQLSSHLVKLERPMHHHTVTTFTANAMVALSKSVQEMNSMPTSLTELPGVHALVDLNNIYRRLNSTLDIQMGNDKSAGLPPSHAVEALLVVLANSVAAVEIGQRGRNAAGSSLIDGVAAQVLSHLQVLASTLNSFAGTTAMVDTGAGDEQDFPYHTHVRTLFHQIYPSSQNEDERSMLSVDGFQMFVRTSFILTRMQGLPVHHLLRLCLTAEMIRVAVWWLKIRKAVDTADSGTPRSPNTPRSATFGREESRAMSGFLFWMSSSFSDTLLVPFNEAEPLYKALRTYALAFMRKATIFLHVAHGVDLPPLSGVSAKPELDRLLSLCRLPDLQSILGEFSETNESLPLPRLARTWVAHWSRQGPLFRKSSIKLLHPCPFELIGLPEHYDTLLALCTKQRCPTTGKSLTDPALCLFCGAIFCSQAHCCMRDKYRGGCNHHIETCSYPIGLYLFIRKCNIVFLDVRRSKRLQSLPLDDEASETGGGAEFLRGRISASGETWSAHGSFFPAPYLTKHGETDQGLRTREQLLLNQRRYDRLVRDVWLGINGSVWSAIARKLEGDVNAGGWETL